MKDLKYADILRQNKALESRFEGAQYKIAVLSNIVTNQMNDLMEYTLRSEEINAHALSGDYDNILQDSLKFKDSNLVVIFWEPANIIDGLHYKANVMDHAAAEALINRVKSEIDFVLTNLQDTALVLFNKFSSVVFSHDNIKPNTFEIICHSLNQYLEQRIRPNTVLVDIDKVLARLSIGRSIDFRYYYSSKALYTIDFYKDYCEYIKPVVLSVMGKARKAMIFDCDNTLWKGIVGEDGINCIQMSCKSGKGVVFEEVQHLALELSRQGIIIGLCSKNNPEDVEEILTGHSDMTLRNEDIVIKKVNWNDKVTNLREIAKELNIGIDSLVLVDDSEFEINYIKEMLPQVTVIQVPDRLHEYPGVLRHSLPLFFGAVGTKEDRSRVEMYKREAIREKEKQKYSTMEEYLRAMELRMKIYVNDTRYIARAAQMTQKTNQFNLTTKRYTEADIRKFISGSSHKLILFELSDKFGDYGISGLCLLRFDSARKLAIADSFLMSCRVIGRNVETVFLDCVMREIMETGFLSLETQYIKSRKNSQVEFFYEDAGFRLVEKSDTVKTYQICVNDYKFERIRYIEVISGREN